MSTCADFSGTFGKGGESVLTVEGLVPLPNGKSVVWKYFGFIASASKKMKDKKGVFCKM